MIHPLKRLCAAVLAVLLLLGLAGPSAEASLDRSLELYERGVNIKTETTVDLNAQTVKGLLALTGMSDGTDEMQTKLIDTVMSILGKLKFTAVGSYQEGFVTVGTDKGELMNVYVSLKPGDAFMTNSLLPGIELRLPEAMAGQMVSPEKLKAVVAGLPAYAEAVGSYMNGEVMPSAKVEEGSFEIEGSGLYDQKITVELTAHRIAGVLNALLGVFRQDTAMQGLLEEAMKSAAAAAEMTEEGAKTPAVADLIQKAEEGIAEMLKEEDKALEQVTVYLSRQTAAMHAEFELQEDAAAVALAEMDMLPAEDGDTFRAKIWFRQEGGSGETEQAVDWAAFKQGVANGSETGGGLVSLEAKQYADKAAGLDRADLAFDLRVMGMQLGLTVNSEETSEGAYSGKSKATLSVLGMPLVTLNTAGHETAEEIPQPSREGLRQVNLSENMSEEESQILMEAANQTGATLMEKLNTALPEEAPVLMSLIESMSQPGEPQQN